MYNNDDDTIEVTSKDFITDISSIFLIGNGVIGIAFLAFFGYGVLFWVLYSGFAILGILMRLFHSDTQKAIVGIIGMISSFYAAVFWAEICTLMTLISMIVLGLNFATVCHVTCTWPNYDYD